MPGEVREREMWMTRSMFLARVTGEGEALYHFPRGTTRRVDLDYWLKEFRLTLSNMVIAMWILH